MDNRDIDAIGIGSCVYTSVTTKRKKPTMQERNLKQQFDTLLKVTIAPALKQMGFKKKGLHFNKAVNNIFQCFNIQKDKWNSNESLSFTFNVGYYCGKINSVFQETNVSISSPQINDCFIQGRISDLTHKKEQWYELGKTESFERVTSQVNNDIQVFLKQHFEKYNSLEKLKGLVGTNDIERTSMIPPLSQFVFLMITNQKEAATKQIKEEYKNALEPQSSTHTFNYPDGRSKIYTSNPSVNQYYITNLEKYAKYFGIELKG